jgi:hypothetical protein
MGVVFRARHTEMDRNVAIKLLKPTVLADKEKIDRFMNEARTISKLKHENIVSVYSVGLMPDGQPYIAMEYSEGKRLSDWVAERGFLSAKDALPLFIQVCDALAHAHEHNIVHRDIKPSNIMIAEEKGTVRVKVVDFGIAKSVAGNVQAITQTGMLVGSAFYMSPGQCAGRASDVRSDVYSLGCTLFETLTGRPPFKGESFFETLEKQLKEMPPAVNDVNPRVRITNELQAMIDCMLQKDPVNRYQTMAVLKQDLERVLAGEKAAAIPEVQKTTAGYLKVPKPKSRRGALLTGMMIAGVLCIPLLVYGVMNRPHPAQDVQSDFRMHHNNATVAAEHGHLEEAEREFQIAKTLAEVAGDKSAAARCEHGIFLVYNRRSNNNRELNKMKFGRQARKRVGNAIEILEPLVLPLLGPNMKLDAQQRSDLSLLMVCYGDAFGVSEGAGNDGDALVMGQKFADLYTVYGSYFSAHDRGAARYASVLDFLIRKYAAAHKKQDGLKYLRMYEDAVKQGRIGHAERIPEYKALLNAS